MKNSHPSLWRMTFLLFVITFGMAFATRAGESGFPKGTNATSLVVITDGNLANSAQKVLIATLQGLVARQSSRQIYIDGGSGYSIWYQHLYSAYGIPYTIAVNPWLVLDQFKGFASGYILYDKAANSDSLNAANSLCGPFNAVAVDASIESTVRSHGITNLLADVRLHNDMWVWTNYNAMLSRKVVVEQKPSFDDDLRDYAAMSGAFTFYEGNSPFRSFVMGQMNPDSACLGWGDASQGESVFVGNGSSNGVFTLAADFALDLSTLSSIRDDTISQKTYANPISETNVHYVTFVMSDGDNVQWNLGGEPGYFNNPARGRFSMGWALSPSLADLAPSVLRWHYDLSSSDSNNDFFVAGPSGAGYMYPSMFPPADLDLHVQRLGDLMTRADLNIVEIIDFNSFSRLDLWNKYLAQPNINGLLYLEYAPYNGAHGAVRFSTNGQPVVAARDLLWSGLEEPTNLIANLNSYPRDPSSPSGYTFVSVLVWSETQANVLQVVTNLAPDVRVVTPDVFVKLVRNNVGRKLSYDFASTLQGWTGGTSGKPYDKAIWTANTGNPPGALLLDGSDLGHPDTSPNSWFSRQIILPPNATALSFDAMANNDGLLRVRLQTGNGTSITLLDWAGLTNHNTWVARTANLSSYAGQTVTLYFEQNDGGLGSGEYRYVDNVVVVTAGPALYPPSAPRLLSAIATNSVQLLWRDNDNNEAGFSIERSPGTGGIWSEIASVGSNVTTYVDGSTIAGASYSYRIRSWNASGFSAYSNIRTAGPAPKRTAIGPANPGFEYGTLSWNQGGSGGTAGSVGFANSPANGPSAAGTNCISETSNGTGNVDFRSDYFPLGAAANGAAPVTFSFDYNIQNTVTAGNQIRVGLRFEDATGGFLGEHNSYIGTPNGDVGGNHWRHFSVTTVPNSTSALNADIRVSMNLFGDDHWTLGTVLFDNFSVIVGSNNVPLTSNITIGALSGVAATQRIVGGTYAPTDADGDPLTVTSVGAPGHGTATTDGMNITYTSTAGYVGTDAFTYIVSDGVGGIVSATVTVLVGGPGLNRSTSPVSAGPNDYRLTFSGAPLCHYVLEWTGNLMPPITWTPQLTNAADVDGLVIYTNHQTGTPGFWRMRYVSYAP
jgi:hypothetical protein